MNTGIHIGNALIDAATPEALPEVLEVFAEAMAYQKQNGYGGWAQMDASFIAADIARGLLYRVWKEGALAAVFCTCYEDPLIWRERERGDALYVHRVAVRTEFHGSRLFATVLDWALQHAAQRALRYVRIDTWANNRKLVDYYKGFGFRFVEHYRTGNDPSLPLQHRNLEVALLELPLGSP